MRINGRRPGKKGPLRGTRRERRRKQLLNTLNLLTLRWIDNSKLMDNFFTETPFLSMLRKKYFDYGCAVGTGYLGVVDGQIVGGGASLQSPFQYEDLSLDAEPEQGA